MTLIKVSESEWILMDTGLRAEGSREEIHTLLVQRLARALYRTRFNEQRDALEQAEEEIAFAFECMRRDGHNMADFGIRGHFIRTLSPEISPGSESAA